MATKQQQLTKDIEKFLREHFNVFEHKLINYVEPKGYTIQENAFIIETIRSGYVYVRAEYFKKGSYGLFTQKFARELIDKDKQIFTFSNDSRFKKNNLLCVKTIQELKDFILEEYK